MARAGTYAVAINYRWIGKAGDLGIENNRDRPVGKWQPGRVTLQAGLDLVGKAWKLWKPEIAFLWLIRCQKVHRMNQTQNIFKESYRRSSINIRVGLTIHL